jgi:hypothetical protein
MLIKHIKREKSLKIGLLFLLFLPSYFFPSFPFSFLPTSNIYSIPTQYFLTYLNNIGETVMNDRGKLSAFLDTSFLMLKKTNKK